MPKDHPERIGDYQITREIGRGGMGVVYLGHDDRLDRPVAIKAIADDLAGDPERLGRFEREARVLASLSHGNIATVYGFEEVDGHRYLVMEFVDGQTLAERLADGPLPVIEALTICSQIAAGVEAAHDAGVVHRDLKPGNVIIRPDGTPKVLDFGLAREIAARSSSSNIAAAATAPQPMTQEGATIGTPGYMSPEQVRGMAIDRTTDNFAFGCVLYECLAGTLVFPGATASDSMAAILEREPDWSTLPTGTPPTVQLLLRRCLQKDRRRRLRDIGDARIELEQAITDPTSTVLGLAGAALEATTHAPRRRWPLVLPWALAAIAVATLAVAWQRGGLRPKAPGAVTRLAVAIPDDRPLDRWPHPMLSDDGRMLVLAVRSGPSRALCIRHLDLPELVPVPNTVQASYPTFSPDGAWLAYFQQDKLKKVSVRGGPATTICDAPSQRGMDWLEDGTIVLAPTNTGGLVRVLDAGGTPEPLTTADESGPHASHRHPCGLPGGRGVLFTAGVDGTNWDECRIMVQPAGAAGARVVMRNGAHGRYVATGHLVFLRESTLMAAPFDLDALDVTGPAVPVVESITTVGASTPAQFSIADNGTLVYMTGEADVDRELIEQSLDGRTTRLGSHVERFDSVRPSPDGQHLAVEVEDESGNGTIMILELARDLLRPLTSGEHDDESPRWSPDGRWIVYSSDPDGVSNLFRIRSDFTGEPERLTTSALPQNPSDWSPDGSAFLFRQRKDTSGSDIYLLRFDESGAVAGEPEPFAVRPGWAWGARFSPDGRWVMYTSTEGGGPNVYVRPRDGQGDVQISTDKGVIGLWMPGGNRILYIDEFSRPATIRSVASTIDEGRFRPALPETLLVLEGSEPLGTMALNGDGTAFLMTRPVDRSASRREPTIVLNWFEELRLRTAGVGAGN